MRRRIIFLAAGALAVCLMVVAAHLANPLNRVRVGMSMEEAKDVLGPTNITIHRQGGDGKLKKLIGYGWGGRGNSHFCVYVDDENRITKTEWVEDENERVVARLRRWLGL